MQKIDRKLKFKENPRKINQRQQKLELVTTIRPSCGKLYNEC